MPDVPTIAEFGYDGFETTAWWGVFAPTKLPDALTATLVAEIERIAASDAFRSRLEPLGVSRLTPRSAAQHSRTFSAANWRNGARPCTTPA